jgi:hypothetical protein
MNATKHKCSYIAWLSVSLVLLWLIVTGTIALNITLEQSLGSYYMTEKDNDTAPISEESGTGRYKDNAICTGKPIERRRLASIGALATQEDWLQFIKCSKNRIKKLVGYYALHVSKSGGMYTFYSFLFLKSKTHK